MLFIGRCQWLFTCLPIPEYKLRGFSRRVIFKTYILLRACRSRKCDLQALFLVKESPENNRTHQALKANSPGIPASKLSSFPAF